MATVTDEALNVDFSAYVTIDDDDERRVDEPALEAVSKVLESKKGPLIALDVAESKIGQDILKVLDEKFKGKLTEVRHTDALDRLF